MFSRTLLSLLLVTGIATAQVGIGTTNPSASSALEIYSESAGLLIPRINLVSTSVGTPVSLPARGLLVYNTNSGMTGGSGIGFYYWTGSNWNKLLASGTGDQLWTKSGSSLYPVTLTDNVGIGTSSPTSPLHVVGTSAIPVDVNGGANLQIRFTEGGASRGYIGSVTGNAQDVDFGTSAGNSGAVHLTTANTPRLTVLNSGNVGVGTTTPTQKLDVAGKVRIHDGTQAAGRILTSDADGVATWSTSSAITPAVTGTFTSSGVTFGGSTSVSIPGLTPIYTSPWAFTGATITLPPGKWIVFGTYLIYGSGHLSAGNSVFIRTTLFTSSSSTPVNTDIISGSFISGTLTGPELYSVATGQTLINNTSGSPKTYYVWANVTKFGSITTNWTVNNFGASSWSENALNAVPTN